MANYLLVVFPYEIVIRRELRSKHINSMAAGVHGTLDQIEVIRREGNRRYESLQFRRSFRLPIQTVFFRMVLQDAIDIKFTISI